MILEQSLVRNGKQIKQDEELGCPSWFHIFLMVNSGCVYRQLVINSLLFCEQLARDHRAEIRPIKPVSMRVPYALSFQIFLIQGSSAWVRIAHTAYIVHSSVLPWIATCSQQACGQLVPIGDSNSCECRAMIRFFFFFFLRLLCTSSPDPS